MKLDRVSLPTKRQLEYLAALGYRGEIPATIQEASDLITELKSQHGQSEFRWGVLVSVS